MTDARVIAQGVEVAVQGSDSDARVVAQGVEVSISGTPSDARVIAQGVEVSISGTPSDARVVAQGVEVSISGTPSDARVIAQGVEVAVTVTDVRIHPFGIASGEAFGDSADSLLWLELFHDGPDIYRVDGPDSSEAFGVPWILRYSSVTKPLSLFGEAGPNVVAHIQPYGFDDGSVFPAPRLLDPYTVFVDDGIPSGEAFGVPLLVVKTCHNFFTPPTTRYVPVAYAGSDVDYLSGAEMPDGRGMLVFLDYGSNVHGELRVATLSSPEAWLANDVVPEGDTTVLLSADVGNWEHLDAASCWEHGGDLYAALMWRQNGHGLVQWYVFDDPADPHAGVTLHTTLQDLHFINPPTYGGSGNPYNWAGRYAGLVAGIPYYLPNGTDYVYTGGVYSSYSTGGSFGVPVTTHALVRAGLWYNGTLKLNIGYYMVGGSYVDYVSPTISRDPRTGYYYWINSGGPLYGGTLWRSTGDLNAWTAITGWNTGGIYAFGFNEYQDLLGQPIWFQVQNGRLLAIEDFANAGTWDLRPEQYIMPFDVQSTKVVVVGDFWAPCGDNEQLSYYLFTVDSVQGTPAAPPPLGGWIVGLVSGTDVASGWQ